MEIRRCTEADIIEAGAFYDAVVLQLDQTRNYPKWQYKVYPSELSVRERTSLNQQFLCLDGETIVGAFVLNDDPQGRYENAAWTADLLRGEYMVCHAFAISPAIRGKGVGKQMAEFCIQYAKKQGYRGIRVDIVPDNLPARRLYEKCGFRYVGDADLERGIEGIPLFSMYELNF